MHFVMCVFFLRIFTHILLVLAFGVLFRWPLVRRYATCLPALAVLLATDGGALSDTLV